MDLFEYLDEKNKSIEGPLAFRMRPTSLDELVGQEHLLGKDKLLYRAIKADKLQSLLFYGPPGTGKTTIARVIANTTKSHFLTLNATTCGKADILKAVEEAKFQYRLSGKKTIIFIDEIHRFNKAQQDALLPFVEDGTIILIGATTENPYFEVNRALISRSLIFELKHLSDENIKIIIKKAIFDEKRGLSVYKVKIDDEAITYLAMRSNGDARVALNALELAVLTTDKEADGFTYITTKILENCMQKKMLNYDKKGENHYDVISAFIKSMRGSDPDATVHYLARMIEAGEDPKFIARRIVICASEDVGNADPQALVVATNAMLAVERIGMPEGRIILSQAALYVATAPKSNASYLAISTAIQDIHSKNIGEIPQYLKDTHYNGAKLLERGIGYLYSHNYPHHYIAQQYLPNALVGTTYYNITDEGYELKIKEHMKKIQANSSNS